MNCSTRTCAEPAEFRVYWPGEVPPPVYCERCRNRALAIAETLGFRVASEVLTLAELTGP